MMKILLGEISSYKAIVVAKHLKFHYPGIKVLAYDYKQAIRQFHTRYCNGFVLVPDPKRDRGDHLRALQNIIQENQIDLFIPVHSDMYGEYIKNKDIFGRAFSYIGDFEQFETLHDKKRVSRLLNELNIKQPRTYDSFDSAVLPFIIKPTNLSSAKGVKYVLTEDDRKKNRSAYSDNLIIQEYVRGTGIGYSVFARDGEILVGFGHKRLAEQPVTGGSSVYRDSHFDQRTRKLAGKLLKAANWSGFAMFEFKLTDDGQIYVIEVNPRIWGSINQGLQNGYNYFEPLLGKSSFQTNENFQYKTYLSPLVYLSFLGYLARFNFRPMMRFLKNIKLNRADVSFFDDPKGFISLLARKL
jgi:predicted ATP-grasp superfamily ATP-dependent carboligase